MPAPAHAAGTRASPTATGARAAPAALAARFAGIEVTATSGMTTLARPDLLEEAGLAPALPGTEATGAQGAPVVSAVQDVLAGGPPGEPALAAPEGPASGGTEVKVSGKGFGECSILSAPAALESTLAARGCERLIVHFGDEPAPVLAAHEAPGDSYLVAFAPPSAAGEGAVDVTVTTPAGTSATSAADLFHYLGPAPSLAPGPAPSISGVSPAAGEAAGFDAVTITGEDLVPEGVAACVGCAGTVVRFGEVAVPVLAGTAKALEVVDPPGTVGPVDVRVSVGRSTSAVESADSFTYVPPASAFTLAAVPSPSGDATPTLEGSVGALPGSGVEVAVRPGTAMSATPVWSTTVAPAGGRWQAPVARALPDGTYTASAEQLTATKAPFPPRRIATFTIDTTAPLVSIAEPVAGATASAGVEPAAGDAGSAPGDRQQVTVTLYRGASLAEPLESHVVSRQGSRWSTVFAGLAAGSYALRAEQLDDAGNRGLSAIVPFTATATATGTATTTAASGSGASGDTGADGHGSVAGFRARRARPPAFMQPFPVVRFVGTDTRWGVRLSLLSVQAPAGASITVRCRGHGCPVKVMRRRARARPGHTAQVRFERLERALRAGIVLVVRVQAREEIGKYTRFAIRRGAIPTRSDACLYPGRARPVACPS